MHVLSIGSPVIDLFLQPDNSHFKLEDGVVSFDLGDKIPTDVKKIGLGGNGANVAVGLTRLEIPTSFYTYLGNDAFSRQIEDGIAKEGVELIADRTEESSASFSVILGFNDDRTIFSHHEKRNHEFKTDKLKQYDFIYLTSIGDVWEKAYEQVSEYAKANSVPIAFSPGSHQLENINDNVRDIIKTSKIFFSNKEEAENILGKENGSSNIKDLLRQMREFGPEIVSITDAEKGSYAINKDGQAYHIGAMSDVGPEKTGAGDSYATGFFAAILHGREVKEAMLWGLLNANSVMRETGAQNGLLTKTALEKALSEENNLAARVLE